METDQERIEDLERKVASLVESFDQINSARPVEPMAETPAAAAPAADDRVPRGPRWTAVLVSVESKNRPQGPFRISRVTGHR